MRLYSWNVNGIRAATRKGMLDWVHQTQAEIYCFQEIKAKPEQLGTELTEPKGYHAIWTPAEKPGYSGCATYSKSEPLEVQHGLGVEEYDSEGRTQIITYKDFTLFNAYFPNSQREHARLPYKLRFCQKIQEMMQDLVNQGQNVILCGDYNIAHEEIDLANPKTNTKNAGFLPEERAWMSQFLAAGFQDVFREQNEGNGYYTWWSNRKGVRERNVGWRLDYHCINQALQDRVGKAEHHTQVMGSDHCPVSLDMRD